MRKHNDLIFLLALVLIIFSIAGCSAKKTEISGLTVLAGSELKDLEPMLPEIQRAIGAELHFVYSGTLDGAEKIMSGEQPIDFAWFSHAKYLSLLPGASSRILAQEKIMLSPVVLGVKESLAKTWGWVDNPDLTWREVVTKAGEGKLHYGMTNPASSNSGFSALMGAASALSGKSDALQIEDIDAVSGELKTFFKGQSLTSGSSGWLVDQYIHEQDHLDGMVNYESVLLSLNKSGKLKERLYLVYPKEGIITADYPILLINENQREIYQKLVDYLRTSAVQEALMKSTLRRPVNTQVKLSAEFPKQLIVELPFPNTQHVVDQLLFSYLDQQVKPSHTFYVLDISGSMAGTRLSNLKEAMNNLAGADTSLTGQFARFRNREKVTILPFSSHVAGTTSFDVDLKQPESMSAISNYVKELRAGGSTAIYTALLEAYQLAVKNKEQEPDRIYSIVLMSDGESNTGLSAREFSKSFRELEGAQGIRTFTILFGEADKQTMQSIAADTGGRMFDASSDPLTVIFKEIRGYQ